MNLKAVAAAVLITMIFVRSEAHESLRKAPDLPEFHMEAPGDILLGGLIPVHTFSKSRVCGDEIDPSYVPYAYSFDYAIREINNNGSILPGISLGYKLFDTCGKDSTALAQALEFLPRIGQNGTPPTVGVVGGRFSSVTKLVAKLLNSYKIPQVSYFSTSDSLSNKDEYKYHLRTILPNRFQVEAMVDVINYFKWTYVSLLYVNDDYGQSGASGLRKLLETTRACLAVDRPIDKGNEGNDTMFDDIVSELAQHENSRVVIIYAFKAEAIAVMSALQRANLTRNFVLFASDGWSDSVEEYDGLDDVGLGALSLKSFSKTIPAFNNYFRSLRYKDGEDNLWFREYWEHYFKCSLNGHPEKPKCKTGRRRSFEEHEDVIENSMIVDAIYAFAHALDSLINTHCSGAEKQGIIQCINEEKLLEGGGKLIDHLRNVSFEGYNGHIEFDERGDIKGKYSLFNYRRTDSWNAKLVFVGSWDVVNRQWNLEEDLIRWPGEQPSAPSSFCTAPCPPHHKMVTISQCCFECHECRDNEIVADDGGKCKECPLLTWPDDLNGTTCADIEPEMVRLTSPFPLALILASMLGIVGAFWVAFVFIRNREDKLIKACSRELSAIMWCGIVITYLIIPIILAPPSDGLCWISNFGFHMSFTVIFSALLTRTIRIFRIFSTKRDLNSRPRMTSPLAQVVITISIIGFMFFLSFILFVVEPPNVELVMPFPTERHVEQRCATNAATFFVLLVCNIVLVVLCCYFAFRTRSLPDNFNESRYISAVTYMTVIMWFAFVPAIFLAEHQEFRLFIVGGAMYINATACLLCLFVSKIYALFYGSEESLHIRTTGTHPRESQNGVPKRLTDIVLGKTARSSGSEIGSYNNSSRKNSKTSL